MSDQSKSDLQVRPKSDDSALTVSRARSVIIARGRQDAALLLRPATLEPPEPADPLSETRRLAEGGDAEAQYRLGEAYHDGCGVQQDLAEALFWYRRAAEQSHLYALADLADMYGKGEGVPKDTSEALRWYRKATDVVLWCFDNRVDRWDPDAEQEILGQAGEYGDVEAQRHYVELIRGLAEWGYPSEQFRLGNHYYRAEWVPQDYIQAHKWFSLAAACGDWAWASGSEQEYASARDAVAAKMTPREIDESQRLASQWKPLDPQLREP